MVTGCFLVAVDGSLMCCFGPWAWALTSRRPGLTLMAVWSVLSGQVENVDLTLKGLGVVEHEG